jgi:hypothetical protein
VKYFIYIFLLLPCVVFSQEKRKKNIQYGIQLSTGKVLIHTKKVYATAPSLSQGIDASIQFPCIGNKDWHAKRHFPTVAIHVAMNKYNSQTLGAAYGIYPSLQHTLFNYKKIKGFVNFGGGIGYATKYWKRNPIQDTMQNILGSALNNFTTIQVGIEKKIGEKINLTTGIGFNHVSNGAMRSPNYGINYVHVFLGANFIPNKIEYDTWDSTSTDVEQFIPKKKYITARVSYSMAENSKAFNGPMYSIYNASVIASKDYWKKNRVYVGIEATYYKMLEAIFKNSEQFKGKERSHAIKYTAIAGCEFLYGKFGLPIQAGVYFNKPNGGFSWYQQLGLNYHFYHKNDKRFLNDMYISATLKTHLANAEAGFIGLGFMF